MRSRTYHPQTCGKVERFHQSLKRWLAKQRPARTPEELQAKLERFRPYYNDVRPHRALARHTPSQAYAARPKAGPTGPGMQISAHYRVRHDRIDRYGELTLRNRSRPHHIGIGRAHAGTRVLVLARNLEIRVITEEGEVLRELTVDPSRDYQAR